MPDATSPIAARWIQRWLIVIGLMVYAMILIGGATRLTGGPMSTIEKAMELLDFFSAHRPEIGLSDFH